MRIIEFAFGFLGMIMTAVAVFIIRESPDAGWRERPDWNVIGRFDTFPDFLRSAVPLIAGIAPFAELALMIPLEAANLADAMDDGLSFSEAFGFGFVSLACAAGVGIVTAWIPHPRGALVWSLVLSAFFACGYEYQRAPPSMALCLVITAVTGLGLGAVGAAGWAAFLAGTPRVGSNRLIGMVIGFVTMCQAATIQSQSMDDSFFLEFSKPRIVVLCMLVAALAALRLPDTLTPPDSRYASIVLP
jgi:hypothetical protein